MNYLSCSETNERKKTLHFAREQETASTRDSIEKEWGNIVSKAVR